MLPQVCEGSKSQVSKANKGGQKMKTSKDERAKMRKFAALKALHSNRAFNPRYALDLIDDVDEAARLLEQQHEHLAPNKKLPHSLCGVCDFLKEPNGAD